MKLFGFEIRKTKKRTFAAAKGGNLYGNWNPMATTADIDIKRDLKTIRNRSRELMRDNDYAKRFKRMVKSNVVGNQGIRLQNKAKDINGNLDKVANDQIENAFKEWSKKGTCDVTGKYSLKEFCKMAIAQTAEDGEVLVRMVKGFPNKFGFALQLIEADLLDEQFSDEERNIHLGIEYDMWSKPIAYHLFKKHPGQLHNWDITRERILAEDIIHLFLPLRISATRGVPWMHTAMTRLKMAGGYEEAELVASRVSAAKNLFYIQKEGAQEYTGEKNDVGNFINEVEPGQAEIVPFGYDIKTYDPQHPTTAFKDFMKTILRGLSSGLDVNYNTLANDLEGVNFSSLRSGVLEEREVWKELQVWLGENLLDEVYSNWLEMALLTQALKLPSSKYDKFNKATWLYRGFSWVDPLKDMQANVIATREGFKTHTQIVSEMGLDLEEVYEQLAKEKELREKYGITTLSEAEVAVMLNSVASGETALEE